MPDSHATKFYPKDAERMTEGSELRKQLELNREVTLGENGWIIDIWDPVSKEVIDNEGNKIGTRGKSFRMPEASELRITKDKTYLPGQEDEFDEGGDAWNLLTLGYQVTFDGKGWIIDIWDPVTKTVRNVLGNEIGTRSIPYVEYYDKEVRNPMGVTVYPEDKNHFLEGSDAWKALEAGYQVTLDEHGFIIDIWNPVTGRKYDVLGNELDLRKDPYPSDNNIANVKLAYEALLSEIAELRRVSRQQKGTEKSVSQSRITSKLREYGRLLWLYGRLLRRKRKSKKGYDRKRAKGTVPQIFK